MKNVLRRPVPSIFAATVVSLLILGAFAPAVCAKGHGLPYGAKPWKALESEGVSAHVQDKTVWLQLDGKVIAGGKVVIPRLCATLRSVKWKGAPDAKVTIKPVAKEWTFSWKKAPAGVSTIELVFDTAPLLPADLPVAVRFDGCRHEVCCHVGPERIETGWWRNRQVRRDYYRVESDKGCHYWIFRERSEGKWFMHGLFD